MQELVRLFAQIALLRKGPQDLPASAALLVATAAAFIIINCVVSLVLPPIPGPWFYQLLVEVLFTYGWYALLLRSAKRPERFVQTLTAIFGYQALLTPLWIATVWLVRQYADDDTLRLPSSVLGLVIVVWRVAINVRIVRAALEWGTAACIAVVILQYLAEQMLLFFLFSPTV
jgi:hypothetical protein